MVVVAAGLATVACSVGEPPTSTGATSASAGISAAAVAPVPPGEFAAALADAFDVNVHVPDEGSIAGTDAAIPYDEVRDRSAELPQDRDAPWPCTARAGA